jgi:hypothetical protein
VLKNNIAISFQLPTSDEEWRKIAREFQNTWQFINCRGALDGKHDRIVPPTIIADSQAQFLKVCTAALKTNSQPMSE